MTRFKGNPGEQAVAVLQQFGVDTCFTLNGCHMWPLYGGTLRLDMRLIDTRHEQTATFAAEGWAKVTRRLGCVNTTSLTCSGCAELHACSASHYCPQGYRHQLGIGRVRT